MYGMKTMLDEPFEELKEQQELLKHGDDEDGDHDLKHEESK